MTARRDGIGTGSTVHGDRGIRPDATDGWPPVASMTVLYDAGCRLCRSAQRWLSSRRQAVPLEFVPAGSPAARQRFPALDPAATLRDLTVVTDAGLVYAGDAGWLACLWALDGYRSWAERFATPGMLPLARRAIAMAAAIRERDRARYGGTDVWDESLASGCTDDRCR